MKSRDKALDDELKGMWGVEGEKLTRLEGQLHRLGKVEVPSRFSFSPRPSRGLSWFSVPAVVTVLLVMTVMSQKVVDDENLDGMTERSIVDFDAFGDESLMLEELI